ncbi:hypothetical protein Sjap_000482 [Stephania japonica]|uniref:Thioredoxin domain-containing protein n=1 Tax=Stephania japonica TaxID=461633 RepID=A0AAP0KKH8_9MAGN
MSQKREIGFDSISERMRNVVVVVDDGNYNKPDFKELDLGSPVSPLRTQNSAAAAAAAAAVWNPTPTTSSSSSSSGSVSGKTGAHPVVRRSGNGSHSGELSGSSEGSPTAAAKTRHVRSNSGAPLIYSGGSSGGGSGSVSGGSGSGGGGGGSAAVNSPVLNALPTGNICPSGRILTTGMACRSAARSDVLGSGTGNYGHGSVMRGGAATTGAARSGAGGGELSESAMVRRAMGSSDPEVVKRAGNEEYKRGHFVEALRLYDRAIVMCPDNAAYRSNRAAALTALGRLGEAVRVCEEAVRLDPGYGRAHQRLASLFLRSWQCFCRGFCVLCFVQSTLPWKFWIGTVNAALFAMAMLWARLGQVENSRKHLFCQAQQPDQSEMHRLQEVERHLSRCTAARKIGDWKGALRECDAATAAGADSSPQLFACRAEALLKLHQIQDADAGLANIPKIEPYPPSCSKTKFFGMQSESYLFYVRTQIEMAFGRFENAVAAAEKAGQLGQENVEVGIMLNNVRLVSKSRARGNELFKSGKFAEACSAYSEGLKLDPSNSVLYCNRAACWSKLEHWEKSVEDCNQALRIQPNYTKALLRRAASNSKLERWVECVKDYEVLRKELPVDNEVAESLFHAQIALKKSRGEEVHNLKFGGEVEEVSDIDQFRAAISSSGVSVVHFKANSNRQCEQIAPFFDLLCERYPSINFLKVDVEESPGIAKTEDIRITPTFKIYKKGSRLKEMICPSQQVLDYSVRHYSL